MFRTRWRDFSRRGAGSAFAFSALSAQHGVTGRPVRAGRSLLAAHCALEQHHALAQRCAPNADLELSASTTPARARRPILLPEPVRLPDHCVAMSTTCNSTVRPLPSRMIARSMLRADPRFFEIVGEVGQAMDRLAIRAGDDVADPAALRIDPPQAGSFVGRARHDGRDDHARQSERRGHRFVGRNDADARRQARARPGSAPARRGSPRRRESPVRHRHWCPTADRMAVLTPISRPAESSSGPPELPGLIARIGLDDVCDFAAVAGRQMPRSAR